MNDANPFALAETLKQLGSSRGEKANAELLDALRRHLPLIVNALVMYGVHSPEAVEEVVHAPRQDTALDDPGRGEGSFERTGDA